MTDRYDSEPRDETLAERGDYEGPAKRNSKYAMSSTSNQLQLNGNNRTKVNDLVRGLTLDNPLAFTIIRFVDGMVTTAGHWLRAPSREGSMKPYYVPCIAHDHTTGGLLKGVKCKFCEFESRDTTEDKDDRLSRRATNVHMNCYVVKQAKRATSPEDLGLTDLEMRNDGVPAGHRNSNTLMMVFSMSASNYRTLRLQAGENKDPADDNETVHPYTDFKMGADFKVLHNKNESPAKQWILQLVNPCRPITKPERMLARYGCWELDQIVETGFISVEEMTMEYDKWTKKNNLDGAGKRRTSGRVGDDDGGMDDDTISVAKAKVKLKQRTASSFDDDDDDTPVAKPKKKPALSFDDDDDDAPVAKPKTKKPAPSFDDDDEDDAPIVKPKTKKPAPAFDDDDDDTPVAKPKKKPAPAFDDDGEDDTPVAKPKKKPAPAFDDDDEDDTPVAKPKKKPAPAFDDDDDDTPVAKPKTKKPAAFDDDDLPF